MEDKKINSFDVLKIMSERNLKIKLFPIFDNLKNANAGKDGWGSITVAVDTETATKLMIGEKMIAVIIVADFDEFTAIKTEIAENEAKMSENDRNNARFLRVAVIRNLLGSGNLDRQDALELLNGNLTPSDPSTYCDDRELLDLTVEEVMARLGIEKPEASDGQSSAGA